MITRIATQTDLPYVSALSVSLGNVPFSYGHSLTSIIKDGNEIIGFAAVNSAWHAAGSWVKERYRHKGFTRIMRQALESALRDRLVSVYFSIPNNEFEHSLFAKYGPVSERIVQVKEL